MRHHCSAHFAPDTCNASPLLGTLCTCSVSPLLDTLCTYSMQCVTIARRTLHLQHANTHHCIPHFAHAACNAPPLLGTLCTYSMQCIAIARHALHMQRANTRQCTLHFAHAAGNDPPLHGTLCTCSMQTCNLRENGTIVIIYFNGVSHPPKRGHRRVFSVLESTSGL